MTTAVVFDQTVTSTVFTSEIYGFPHKSAAYMKKNMPNHT